MPAIRNITPFRFTTPYFASASEQYLAIHNGYPTIPRTIKNIQHINPTDNYGSESDSDSEVFAYDISDGEEEENIEEVVVDDDVMEIIVEGKNQFPRCPMTGRLIDVAYKSKKCNHSISKEGLEGIIASREIFYRNNGKGSDCLLQCDCPIYGCNASWVLCDDIEPDIIMQTKINAWKSQGIYTNCSNNDIEIIEIE